MQYERHDPEVKHLRYLVPCCGLGVDVGQLPFEQARMECRLVLRRHLVPRRVVPKSSLH